ncbi:hypothetical protein ACFQZS_17020 [Mucilaginibacter calamicampi]|uniref:NACHT domain-containing protein n=1 Tax=Mucilaginibacter calamicampi TaxID=1302352 RepID=A0ABW2Z196_9SPHI
MSPFLPSHLEELKSCVLATAGIKNPIPADCKLLSILINKKTRQNVSETTLKRIYGFAHSKFKPSLFTINTMAQFCDYGDWQDFHEKKISHVKVNETVKNVSWKQLQQKAATVTNFTLQALKNKSVIPYSRTIKREFIDYHINEFVASASSGTVLAAPAGYGKTVAICHWIDEKLAADEAGNSGDIILLFSSNAVVSAVHTAGNISNWLLSLLGYSTDNDVKTALDVAQRKNGKFFLIVDGLDEFMFKNDQFRTILNQLVDVFAFYQSHSWFKLILTTRTSTWINNRHYVEFNSDTWYTGFHSNSNYINVPLFDLREINALCHKINPEAHETINPELAEIFNHPLYFQEHYKLHKNNFSLSSADHTSLYELIAAFILNKVYLSSFSSEKIAFINAIVGHLDIKNNNYSVNKLKIEHLIKQYPHAYLELISLGFLRELNESSAFQYNTHVQFGNYNYLEYSIAQALLFDNDERFDSNLMTAINKLLNHNPQKVNVLKWCVIHAVKVDGLKGLEHITEVELNPNEKTSLVTFIGELLEREYSLLQQSGPLMQYFRQPLSDKIFQYFFGLELINPHYRKTLNTLLKLELSNKRRIIILTALGIIALVELNLDELHKIIDKLETFPADDFNTLPVNPLNCFDTYYHCLKYNIVKKDAIRELTHLYFNPPEDKGNLRQSACNDMLYLLGVHTLLLCRNPRKILRLVNFLMKNYRADSLDDYTTQYGYFIQVHKASMLFEMGCRDKAGIVYKDLSAAFANNRSVLTPFMTILFHFLRIRTMMDTPKQLSILNEVKSITAIAEKSGYKYLKLRTMVMLMHNENLRNSAPEFYRHIAYEVNKICRENGLNVNMFLVEPLQTAQAKDD